MRALASGPRAPTPKHCQICAEYITVVGFCNGAAPETHFLKENRVLAHSYRTQHFILQVPHATIRPIRLEQLGVATTLDDAP